MNLFKKLIGHRAQPSAESAKPRCRAEKVLLIFPWMPIGGLYTLFSSLINLAPGYRFEAVTTREQLANMGDSKAALAAIGCPVQDLTSLADSELERQQILLSILEKGEYGTLIMVGSTMA